MPQPTCLSRCLRQIVPAGWKHHCLKWSSLFITVLLCLLSFILVASLPVSAHVEQRALLSTLVRPPLADMATPTPTSPAFVPQPSPQPIPSLPTNYQQQVNILQAKNRFFYHGNVNLPEVALTFDDGPNPPFTSRVLDVLQRYDVKASFFEVGYLARRYPDLVRREVADGHTVGNHTWNHAHLPALSTTGITKEINDTSDELQKITGTRPTFFRPPYGETDNRTLTVVNNLGLTTFIWNAMASDWLRPDPSVISFRVTNVARNGMIILLHDGGGDRTNTVVALSTIIQNLRVRGFRFVTLSQLVDHARG
jgi:peptidoglycan/xylan/chitin deacetylase (PgdA/CDA1 family)